MLSAAPVVAALVGEILSVDVTASTLPHIFKDDAKDDDRDDDRDDFHRSLLARPPVSNREYTP